MQCLWLKIVGYKGSMRWHLSLYARRSPLVGRWEKLAWRCLCVCMYCQSTFASGARTAGRMETGEYSIDGPARWKDDGISFGPIGCT